MSIRLACSCGHQFEVDDDLAGKLTSCPECGNAMAVPLPDDEDELLPPMPEYQEPELTPPKQEEPAPPSLEGPSLLLEAEEEEEESAPPPPDEEPGLAPLADDGPDLASLAAEEESVAAPAATCPSCGKAMTPGAVVCVQCGFDTRTGRAVGDGQPAQTEAEDKPKAGPLDDVVKRFKALPKAAQIGAAAGVGLLVIVLAVVLLSGGEDKPGSGSSDTPVAGPKPPRVKPKPNDRQPPPPNPPKLTRVTRLSGHQAPITSVAVSTKGPLVATGDAEGNVRLWDYEAKETLQTFKVGEGEARVAFAVGSRRLLAADRNSITTWDVASGRQRGRVELRLQAEESRIADLSRDGRYALATQPESTRISIWQTQTGMLIQMVEIEGFVDAAFSAKGDRCILATEKGPVLLSVSMGGFPEPLSSKDTACAAISRNGDVAISGAKKGVVWDVKKRKSKGKLNAPCPMTSAVICPGDRFALTGGKQLVLWDLSNGMFILVADAPDATEESEYTAVAFSADAKMAFAARGNVLEVFKASDKIVASLGPPRGPVVISGTVNQPKLLREMEKVRTDVGRALVFSPNLRHALSADGDGRLRIWDLSSGKPEQEFVGPGMGQGVGDMAFSPDGETVFLGGEGGLILIDVDTGAEVDRLDIGGMGKVFLTAGGGHAFVIRGREPVKTIALPDGQPKPTSLVLPAEQGMGYGQALALAFTSDARLAALGGSLGRLELLPLTAGEPKRRLRGHLTQIHCVAFTTDGRYLLSGAGEKQIDCSMRVWDVASGKPVYRFRGDPGHPVSQIAVSADGRRAMFISKRTRLVDLETGHVMALIDSGGGSGKEPDHMAVALSAKGQLGLTARKRKPLVLWQLPEKLGEAPAEGVFWKVVGQPPPPPTPGPGPAAPAQAKADPSPVEKATLAMMPALKEFWEQLRKEPRTSENLLALAKWCYDKQLFLEAEECLRGALLAQPDMPEALKPYKNLIPKNTRNRDAVSTENPYAEAVAELKDMDVVCPPPEGKKFVSVMMNFRPPRGTLRIDTDKMTAKAGDEPAQFVGFLRKPQTRPKRRIKKGLNYTQSEYLWEIMLVKAGGSRKVTLQNKQSPLPVDETGGAYKTRSDGSLVEEAYRGPYMAIFAVPAGSTLTQIALGEVTVDLLSAKPVSMESVLLDKDASATDVLVALKALSAPSGSGGPGGPGGPGDPGRGISLDSLEAVNAAILRGDPKALPLARDLLRVIRRSGNLVSMACTPQADAEAAGRFIMVAQGLSSGMGAGPMADPRRGRPVLQVVLRMPKEGKYGCRIAAFGPGPDYTYTVSGQGQFNVPKPGLYVLELSMDGDAKAESAVTLVELWSGRRLLKRRVLGTDAAGALTVAGGIPMVSPGGGLGMGNPGRDSRNRPKRPFQSFSNEAVQIVSLLDGAEDGLPMVFRIARNSLTVTLGSDQRDRMIDVLGQVARLQSVDEAIRRDAVKHIVAMLGAPAADLFEQLAEDGPQPINHTVLEGLRQMASWSPQACRALIVLQTAPAEVVRANAKQLVEALKDEGVIRQKGQTWQYVGGG